MPRTTVKIKRDPAKAKRLIGQYEKELVALFQQYAQDVTAGLNLPGRALASEPIRIDPDRITTALETAGATLMYKGRLIIRQATRQAYQKGLTYSGILLKRNKRIEVTTGFFTEADQRALKLMMNKSLSDLKGINDETSKQIVRVLTKGLQNGDSMDKLAAAITDRVSSIGIVRARAMARTETMDVLNDSSLTRYEQHGLDRVQCIEAADDRCCDECMALHLKIFTIAEARAMNVHPNCRRTWAPAPKED